MAGSTVSDALAATPPNADLPSDEMNASVATVNSSNCDLQSPDEAQSSQPPTWLLFLRLRMLPTSSLLI